MRTMLSDSECFQLVKHFGLEVWCREVEFGKWEWGVSGRSHWVKASGPDLNEIIAEYIQEVVCVR